MKTIKFLMAAILMLCMALPSYAETDRTITVSMTKTETSQKEGPEYPEKNDRGRRQPAIRVECVIDATSGVEFVYGETPEFVSYEICDTEGATVASFGDETSFIEVLFTMTGEYQLRLVSADYEYVGWVML